MTRQSHNVSMNVRSQKKQEKIERILDHGIEAFRVHGYHSSSVQDLADFCKISKGSFYQYFESKEHFCQQVILHYSRKMASMVSVIFDDESLNGLEKLVKFYEAILDRIKNADFKTGCLYGDLSAELGGVNAACSETLSVCLQKAADVFESVVIEGQKDGSIRSDIDAKTLSSMNYNSFSGAILRMKVDRNLNAGKEFISTYVKKLLAYN